jgi:Domain of unknown function (DUF6265)
MTASLESLGWMAGYWRREADGSRQEEVWLEPLGGCMIGLDRDVSSSGRVAFEHLRIQREDDGSIVLHVSLGGRPSIAFALTASADHEVTFERGGDSFPARIRYWLAADAGAKGAAVLHCKLDGGGREMEWSWPRAD